MALHVSKPIKSFLRVGVTGGIGSGKSTACKLFEKLGRTVLSADGIARQLTETNDDVKLSIRNAFGDKVFFENGLLNRSALATIIFQNQSLRKKLDAIVHPHVFAAVDHAIEQIPRSKLSPYVLIEAALIFESGMDERMDYTIVVHADEQTRIQRVMERDKIDRTAVVARIESQMDPKEKKDLADFVIENDGDESELLERVKFLDRILSMMKSPQ